jgi:hypothetical protein
LYFFDMSKYFVCVRKYYYKKSIFVIWRETIIELNFAEIISYVTGHRFFYTIFCLCAFVFNEVRTNSFVKEDFIPCPRTYVHRWYRKLKQSNILGTHCTRAHTVNHYKVIYLVCLRSSLVMLLVQYNPTQYNMVLLHTRRFKL